MPAHRAGEETLKGKDIIVLKNRLKEVKKDLTDQGMSDKEISDLFKTGN